MMNRGGGGGGGGVDYGNNTYDEKHRVAFIYLVVDKMIFLLSVKIIDGCPYKYNCD